MLGEERVGQLVSAPEGVYFGYDILFARKGIELSPYKLPLQKAPFKPFRWAGNNLPGLFVDSLPDKYGREVIAKHLSKEGKRMFSDIQLLAYLGKRTIGALTYEPATGYVDNGEPFDLVKAARESRRISNVKGRVDKALLLSGSTAGGAAPKALVAIDRDPGEIIRTGSGKIPDGSEPWLLKFTDPKHPDIGLIEYTYSLMAKEAGIQMPETRLVLDTEGIKHYAVRRFDRGLEDPNERYHVHSYAGLGHLDFSDNDLDYMDLLETTYDLTKNQEHVVEQFRRMVFNVMAHCRDDHAKNFSFMLKGGDWQITPAYDVIFSNNIYARNYMLVDQKASDELNRADLERVGEKLSISRHDVSSILERIEAAIARWSRLAKDVGVGCDWTEEISLRTRAIAKSLEPEEKAQRRRKR